jgi:outer membrane protein assembly factor BamB
MPTLHRSLISAATAALLAGVATGCGDDSDPSEDGPGSNPTSLSDVEFHGDEPLAWPRVDLCGDALLLSPNLLAGQSEAAIYQLDSGDGVSVDVELPDDSQLDPGAGWATGLDCVETDDGTVVLARYSPVMDMADQGGAWAGFDVEGNQLWVHEFTDYTSPKIGHGVVAFETGDPAGEEAETRFVDAASGEVTLDVTSEPSTAPMPVNGNRYVGTDGLADLTGEVINPDVPQYGSEAFGAGSRVLVDSLDLAAYDADSGEQLWTSDLPDPLSGAAYDASLETLVWEVDDVVYGVDGETGEELWSYRIDQEISGDVYRAGSGIAIVGTPTLDENCVVLDTKTGEPVQLPSGASVLSVDSGGIAIVDDGELRVVDRQALA